ncbi:hypothetical protein CFRS1_v007870 [Colletotrichum fructicola]|nr:hypothetical protein CFRS1_v007870 [Colletotrichum fructicola]
MQGNSSPMLHLTVGLLLKRVPRKLRRRNSVSSTSDIRNLFEYVLAESYYYNHFLMSKSMIAVQTLQHRVQGHVAGSFNILCTKPGLTIQQWPSTTASYGSVESRALENRL